VSAFRRIGVVKFCLTRIGSAIFWTEGTDSFTYSPSLRVSAPSMVRPRFLQAETRAASLF